MLWQRTRAIDAPNTGTIAQAQVEAEKGFNPIPVHTEAAQAPRDTLIFANCRTLARASQDPALNAPQRSALLLGWGATSKMTVAPDLQQLNVSLMANHKVCAPGENYCAQGILAASRTPHTAFPRELWSGQAPPQPFLRAPGQDNILYDLIPNSARSAQYGEAMFPRGSPLLLCALRDGRMWACAGATRAGRC